MKRLTSKDPSSLGKETIVRMTQPTARALCRYMRENHRVEQMAFAFGRHAATSDGTLFLVHELFLPDRSDLATQSVGGVSTSRPFLYKVYEHAYRTRQSIVEFHTHPGVERPHFSGIDEHHGTLNARSIAEKFKAPVTLVLIVGNNLFDSYDGVVYDRHRDQFRQLDRLEFLGKPTETWTLGEPDQPPTPEADEAFDRQRRIPGWNQAALERQRIGIIGAGGNGGPLLQSLVAMGAAVRGFLAVADHDVVEESNLPRIPYANRSHVGVPKVAVATQFAGQKSPSTPFYPFPCKFDEPAVQKRFKAANVLLYCGDNDGGRKEANAFAVRYGIPLIDLGCDVQVSDDRVEAGGQVRLVLPGENACLVCSGGFDAAQAAKDQMTDADRAEQAARGYVVRADAEATPSVANLNGLTVQFAVSQFLALVNGPEFARWDYLHFDQFTGKTIPAISNQHESCPTCGPAGIFMKGDPTSAHTSTVTKRRARHAPQPAAETLANVPAQYTSPPFWQPESGRPDHP